MRDLMPEDMALFRRIEVAFRDVCLGWGYEEMRTPTIEHLHLFTSAGLLSPQMLGKVYSFLDWDGWSGERVVLRPDSTIPLARTYAEVARPGDVWKRFYVQNVLRFAEGDNPREGWQCGIELIGDTQPAGDVELIAIASEVLRRLGLQTLLKLSDPGILRAIVSRAGYDAPQQLVLYDRLLNGELDVLDEVAERIEGVGAILKSLLSLEGEGAPYIRNLQAALADAIPSLQQPLTEILTVSEILTALGNDHLVSPLLVRNFEYYTGPVFHLYVGDTKVASGGRYDGLIGLVGGADVAASGFGIEMDALMPLLPRGTSAGPAVNLRAATPENSALAAAFKLATAFRDAGIPFRITDAAAEPGQILVPEGVRHLVAGKGFLFSDRGAVALRGFEDPVRLFEISAGV